MDKHNHISPIRDVVHDYVAFSVFERDVIDSPYFQRLHFVLQNSAAYTAYPSNKNSRYIHSLGVAHLCGKIFIQSLKNSHNEDLRSFLTDAAKFIKSIVHLRIQQHINATKDLQDSWRRNIGNSSRFLHNPLIGPVSALTGDIEGLDPLFIINTVWVSLRIVGLVHDIGHLPMSHLFEDALETLTEAIIEDEKLGSRELPAGLQKFSSASKIFSADAAINTDVTREWIGQVLKIDNDEFVALLNEFPIHEVRSLQILNDIFINLPPYEDAGNGRVDERYRSLIFMLASVINFATKDSNEPKARFLRFLKQIVSSELDADRLDYTLRDPRASGLELGHFDVSRIVSNFILVQKGNENDRSYELAITDKCISAVENFFHQRYLNYTTLIYHRTGIKYKAVLKEAIAEMYLVALREPGGVIAEILDRNGFLARDSKARKIVSVLPTQLRKSVGFDDARLRSVMFELVEQIAPSDELFGAEDSADRETLRLGTLLQTFLFRKKENIYSFGKGVTSIAQEMDKFDLGENGLEAYSVGEKIKFSEVAALIKLKQDELDLADRGRITILLTKLSPKTYVGSRNENKAIYVAMPSLKDSEKRTLLTPIHELSIYLRDHAAMASSDRDFAISFVARGVKRDDQIKKKCDEVYGWVLQKILEMKNLTTPAETVS